MDKGNIDAREASSIDWRHVFFSDRLRSAYYQGLVASLAWTFFVFSCALFYSLGQMEGTELSHHLQNAVAISSWVTLLMLGLGMGFGFLLFLDIGDERSLMRTIGYATIAVPMIWAAFGGGGFDTYEPPQEAETVIEIDAGRVMDWWESRDD